MEPLFFVATAIDYTNGAPHLGHAYEKVLADVLARFHRLKGEDTFFLTGVDQHGQKVQQSADKQGVAPQVFVDSVTAQFASLWKKLDVCYDGWAATTEESHKRCVRAILQRLWDDKDPATGASRWIYKDKRGGYYSVRQEQFLTDKERGPDGQFGPEWGTGRVPRGGELLFQARRLQAMAARPDRRAQQGGDAVRAAGFPRGGIAERRGEAGRRPVHFPAQGAVVVGDRVPVRRRFRYLRLVRCACKLPFVRAGLRRGERGKFDGVSALVAGVEHHRQRHPDSGARDLLADHAAVARFQRRRDSHFAGAWLVEH